MINIIEENPLTFSLVLIFALIGLLLPSPLEDFILNFNLNNIDINSPESITGFVVGYHIVIIGEIFIRIIYGLIGGIFGIIVGLFIDGINNYGELI